MLNEGYAMTKDEKTARGCASNLVVDEYTPRWGCPHTLLSDRGTELISQVSRAVYQTLGAVNNFTSSYHPQTNGMVKRINHTLSQMLSYLIADGWPEILRRNVDTGRSRA